VTYQPIAGMVDAEHHIVLCRGAEYVGAPTGDEVEADLIEWIPMRKIPDIAARGDAWTSRTLIGVYAAKERISAGRG
jgi:hypothetical protein